MSVMRKIMIFILAAISFAACVEYDINEVLLVRTDVSLSHKGKVQYTFDPSKGQMGGNADKTLYRYMSDNLGSWMEVKFKSRPGGVGETVMADIQWKSRSSIDEIKGLEFEIKQTEGNGMIWLWNSENNIGLVIRDFE